MLYHWYELNHAAVRPMRAAAGVNRLALTNALNPFRDTPAVRHAAAALELFERVTRRYGRPDFAIESTHIGGQSFPVREEVIWRRPFCRLLAFHVDLPPSQTRDRPRLLIVAPMSGHFASLLRGTVTALLPAFDVFITDWSDARDVPLHAGTFGLAEYIDYVTEIIYLFGGDVHVYAVCQPSVPVLAAVSLIEQEQLPAAPRGLILTGGPIDTRINPTMVTRFIEERGTPWFHRNTISTVPWPNIGFGRQVYPGFLQLSGFMSMNLERHVEAHGAYFRHLVQGDGDSAEFHRVFYDDYLAVMDLTAEFFLETLDTVFIRHALPRGEMRHRDRLVQPKAITRPALLTIEAGGDDIAGVGQCSAAHLLCTGIPNERRAAFVCPRVGHYGLFNGARFRNQIAPRIAEFIFRHDPREGALELGPNPASQAPCEEELASSAFSFGHR